ncbi:asparagine synthase (glutamine-hydrolyzing) [Candidatus Kaiserbacteria bacterium RIFCSPHIGHO2_01_FULL_50_13]|uniref:asparagine synthase (glutamine-hydrolyzing) n=1 Tax=Candidatus Kaiserbacteria bacterium RIFCSPLOWO2_01_FULL_50_24 TaxID=1798507 RepID=A0A1F6EIW7_9BACT|nr:MAG: asparagine synthase (glutamine-hydrolyzing) [Candidatus Kaiserbacteria bacterium RIFCSPHIGHO2_01_FULL_50_13]OGG73568.1 MAG: asparagine synthase (glutamine-hydrolyzing) [Candidatus Kaiserbacteria bacterium RIFCSPLOWO2_01_FULL_50_24]OGG82191.1 MAG: asparagine synthase (glutamine-hydrolyzing) [Candidatus Kaiserbacteria bacterium RIFCSPLOWO2_02_FULL_51_13]
MCGIAGFVGSGDAGTLSGMIGILSYRGPDDSGVWHSGRVGFAHARLSIIDLSSAGHQPMQSGSGMVTITFNGEIYNYRELRKELEHDGKIFKSKSDTEVILELYEAYGEESFKRLQGMFAFALHDKKNDKCFLVRDRMGEKPLYWTIAQGTLVFASEPKALFKHPLVSKCINPQAIASYLTYDAVLTPESIFEGVHKLEAATYVLYANGKITTHTYWKPPQQIDSGMAEYDALARLDTALKKSVSLQMIADVPVGVFLSGGLDSSTIAYYAGLGRKEPVHTFSIGFNDLSYDESFYAREAAASLGTKHHERIVTAEEVMGALLAVAEKLDEPVADPAILPTYLLAQFAREHVKVALGGEGSDELFGGYQTFTAERFLRAYRALPQIVRRGVIEPLVAALPVSHKYFSFDFKARQFLRGAEVEEKYAHQAWLESFNASEKAALLSPAFKDILRKKPYQRIDEYLAEIPNADRHLQTAYLYLRMYMLDVLLTKVDRVSMYHSLEVRAPFLDVDVVDLALRMPWKYKYRGMTGKYILRQLMKDRLPPKIVSRKKHGFGLPVGQWFRKEWKEFLFDTLSTKRIQEAGIFSPPAVNKLIAEHLSGERNHRKKLWSLLVFHLWYARWGTR